MVNRLQYPSLSQKNLRHIHSRCYPFPPTHLSPVNHKYVLDLINAVADSFIDALGMS